MGDTVSLSADQRQQELNLYANALFTSAEWKGFDIDQSLQKFSGLGATAQLNAYRDYIIQGQDLIYIGNTLEKLGSTLGGLTPIANALGPVALCISMLLEIIGVSLGKNAMGTAQMLRRVFAEEKASEVRDLMDDYLKRLQITLRNPRLQLDDTRRLEAELSTQLTRLQNSMVFDGHMSTRFLKQWVNGAAFHTQMLIHEARLEGSAGVKATLAAAVYHQQMNFLLEKYKAYLQTVASVHGDAFSAYQYMDRICSVEYGEGPYGKRQIQIFNAKEKYCFKTPEFIETLFQRPEIAWAKTYFSDLQANIPFLVKLRNNFVIIN
ncbi:uncharacterized protein LOC101174798 [Oryzias latipes]|uniref:uncharacterized protein LOC101174798 n=1 Tax=Oryzias latipes TaxID=8090 RepID=UPI0000EA19D0|nr:uncharacterized protein LOC101174798 [Oryzias latipes]